MDFVGGFRIKDIITDNNNWADFLDNTKTPLKPTITFKCDKTDRLWHHRHVLWANASTAKPHKKGNHIISMNGGVNSNNNMSVQFFISILPN